MSEISQLKDMLAAFIDATGYELETIVDRQERKEDNKSAMRHNDIMINTERALVCGYSNMLEIDEDGMYTSYLKEPIISYKVTKRDNEGSKP